MIGATPGGSCRSCRAGTLEAVLDLGPQPDPDRLLDPAGADAAPEAPILLAICSSCGLLQLVGPRPEGPRSPHGHALPAEGSDPWAALIARSIPDAHPRVVDLDGSSGLPAAAFHGPDSVAHGLSPGDNGRAGLILVGHALAHADELDALVGDIGAAIAPGGLVAIDFHHVLGIAQGQFDVLAHSHRSYLSLRSLDRSLDRHGLHVVAATKTDAYGGTIRVLAARQADGVIVEGHRSEHDEICEAERAARIELPVGFTGLEDRVSVVCRDLVAFLDAALQEGRTVVGYGAASRGTALLNFAGVGVDRLPFIADRAAAKQNRRLPRAHIPIVAPSEIVRAEPDDILILPWPLARSITEQLAPVRTWGARFVAAMPRLEVLG
jgi:hypothetical protein